MKILVAEDDRDIADLIAHYLHKQGWDAHLVCAGDEALAYTKRQPVDLVILDLMLGDVWGYRYTGGTRTVDVHVRRLREKLPALVDALVTVKQFGYKLADNEVT